MSFCKPVVSRTLALWCAAGLALPSSATGQSTEPWRPRTTPLYGVSYAPDVGLLIGAGLVHTRYAFHALPPSTRLLAHAAYATRAGTAAVEVMGEFRQPLAPATLTLELRASGLEIIRFYGLGNATGASGPDSIYQVRQTQFLLAPAVSMPLAPRLRLAVGPLLKHARTRADSGTLLTSAGPRYGVGAFGQVGARAALELDTRDAPVAAANGLRLRLAAEGYPAAWDAAQAFGTVFAEAATYLSVGDPAAATCALRLGAGAALGHVPFHELVYVGGDATLRGYAEQRFAGRKGAYANAELRLRIGGLKIGDVWIAGESSDRWHDAAGGGLWFAPRRRRAETVSIAVARSPERTALYLRAGFLF